MKLRLVSNGRRARRSDLAEAQGRLADEFAYVARLQRELERVREGYKRARAELDRDVSDSVRGDLGKLPKLRSTSFDPTLRTDRESGARERPIGINDATFEDLRALGLSVTQVARVLRRRAEGRLTSLDDLDSVPGIPRSRLIELKRDLGS